eukprot:gene1459-12078_t
MEEETNQKDEEVLENILITLQEQNKRLSEHQERSYSWHLKHHENINIIMGILNNLDQNRNLEISKNKADSFNDFSNPTDSLNLHQTVIKLMKVSKLDELEKVLLKVESIDTFSELKDESMSLIFPIVLKWLENTSTAKSGIIFLYEGLIHYENAFRENQNIFYIQKMISRLDKLYKNLEEVGIEKQYIDDVYNSLLKISF